MAGTLTIVVGLCGAGKSWLVDHLARADLGARVVDEGCSDDGKRGATRRESVAWHLNLGRNVYVADLWCGWAPRRKRVVAHLRRLVPGLRVVWFYYALGLAAANSNCKLRRNKGDAAGHIRINMRWHARLTAPRDAIVLRTYRLDGKGNCR
jgi:hypothetical protein